MHRGQCAQEGIAYNDAHNEIPSSDRRPGVGVGGQLDSCCRSRHGTTVAALMQINNLSDPNFIYVGQRIRLS
jgi:hypothetical protein